MTCFQANIVRLLAFTVFVVVLSCERVQAVDAPLKLVQTIPLAGVEGRIDHMAADPAAKRLYIAALGNNTLEVVDLAAGKRMRSVTGLKKPTGIRVLPSSHKVIVASGDDGKCRIFDADLKLLGTVNDLPDADNVRLDPSGIRAYVGYADGALAIIDLAAFKKIGDIRLDGHPESFQLERAANRIFVNVPTARQVTVADRDKQTVTAKWLLPAAADNFPMALDETHRRLFIGCRTPAKMVVIDTESGKTIATLDCCGDTDDVFYDATNQKIYLTGGEGCISIFGQQDADHYASVETIRTAPGARTSLFVPELNRLYVAVPRRDRQKPEIRVYTRSEN